MGQIPIKYETTRQESTIILPSAPVSNRRLEFTPVTDNSGSLSITSSTNSAGKQTLVVQREGPSPVAEAEIDFLPSMEPVRGDVLVIDPPVWSSNKGRWSVDKTPVEADEQRRSTAIGKLTKEIDALTKDLDRSQSGLNKIGAAELAEKQEQLRSKTIARNGAQNKLNECISQLKYIDLALLILQSSFQTDRWSISVTTSLSPPAVPDTSDPQDALGDRVVIVRGLPEGQPVQLEKFSSRGPASTDIDKPR
jgi:hypothetical protein